MRNRDGHFVNFCTLTPFSAASDPIFLTPFSAEILANIALRDGEQDLPPHIVSHERFPGQHFSLKSLSNPATFTASD
jgi:hypothetical protein